MRAEHATVRLMGTPVHAITERQAIDHIMSELARGRGGWVVTPNLDHLRRLRTDAGLRELYRTAGLSLADGMPLIWAARLQGTPLPGRVPGSSLIWSLSRAAGLAGRSLFLLGGDPGTAEEAAATLKTRFPNVRIAGTACPDIGFERSDAAMRSLVAQLSDANPDIVFVALGSPKQERLIGEIGQILPNAWWLGIGISFSFVCGRVRRAPAWMQNSGLEWLHRLSQEPGRLAQRYLVQGLPFAIHLLGASLVNRVRGASA